MKIKEFAKFALAAVTVIVLSAVCAAAAWDGTVSDAFSGGDGSEENPYLISCAEELAHLAGLVNSPETNAEYAPLCYRLTDDIDISGHEWTPIGVGAIYENSAVGIYPFTGVFDADGHKVAGLTFTDSFSVSWKKYEIETATVGGIEYKVYTEDGKPVYKTKTLDDGTTEYVYKNVSANAAVGLFGYNGGIIRNLDMTEVSVAVESAKTLAGAVSGISEKMTVTFGTWRDGEFLKSTTLSVADSGNIENCRVLSGEIEIFSKGTSSGTPAGSFNIAGGIVGYAVKSKTYKCFSAVKIFGDGILGDTAVGGIAGRASGGGSQNAKILLCTSAAEIDAVAGNMRFALLYGGGTVGLLQSAVVENCAYSGKLDISGGGNISLIAVGGVAGSNTSSYVRRSFADADISVSELYGVANCTVRAGLLVGTSSSGTAVSGGCFAFGKASVSNGSDDEGYTSANAVTGKNDAYIYADVYCDGSAGFLKNGEKTASVSAVSCTVKKGSADFKECFPDIAGGTFYFTDDIFSEVVFETANYRMSSDGTLLSYDLFTDADGNLILPYGTKSVADGTFDGMKNKDAVKRVIAPYSLSAESKKLVASTFDGKTVQFAKTSHDNLLNRAGVSLRGDWFVSGSTASLYVGNGDGAIVPSGVKTATHSGLYDLARPACVTVNSAFSRAYLGYFAGGTLLHFDENCDFAEYCAENDLSFEMLADLDNNGAVTLHDLSLFAKYIESGESFGCHCGYMFDVTQNGSVDKNDLISFLKMFAN